MKKITAKKLRICLMVSWAALLIPLLALIRYAEVTVAMQGLVDILVAVYQWGSIVVIAIMEWLRRRCLREN